MSHNGIMICYLFFSISGHGLKCYGCLSTSSWADCHQQEIFCAPGLDTCAKVYFKVEEGGLSFAEHWKGCSTTLVCNAKNSKLCKKAVNGGECTINCCSGDLCNSAAIQVINVIFLVLCAFLASVMIQ